MSKLITIENLKTFLDKCDKRYQGVFVIGGSNDVTTDTAVNDNSPITNWVIGTNVPDNLRGTSDGFSIITTPVNTPEDGRPTIAIPTNLVGGVRNGEPLTTFKLSAYTSIKLSNLPGLTSTKLMFNGCKNLTNLNLIGLDTSNVTDMSNMISGCSALKNININTLNTTSTESMASMFEGDTALESIDLTSFDLRKVTNLSNMFRGCTSLKEITFGNGFKYGFNEIRVNSINTQGNTTAAMDCRGMFSGCAGLTSLDLSYIDPAGIFVNLDNIESSEIFDKEHFKENIYFKFINGLKYDPTGSNEWFAIDSTDFYNKYIINIGMQGMFDGCTNLNTITTGRGGNTYEFHFGHTPWQIQQLDGQYKPVFTICDLSSCHLDNTTLTYHLFDINRLEYDGSKKSLFGIILDDDNFNYIKNNFSSRNWFQSNGGRVYFDGYIIISKRFFEASLISEIIVDDGQEV